VGQFSAAILCFSGSILGYQNYPPSNFNFFTGSEVSANSIFQNWQKPSGLYQEQQTRVFIFE
jgi:hypothetical protein